MASGTGQTLGPAAVVVRAGRRHRRRRRQGADDGSARSWPQPHPTVDALAGLDRPLLERYLAWLVTAELGPGAREDAVTCLDTFFQALRRHGWDPDPADHGGVLHRGPPPRRELISRHLSEHVMAQVEAPANLDRWPNPEGRLVTMILIRCGLRATDACTLAFDCLLHDGQGAAYLRYLNHKMRREAAVPIDDDLEAEIRAQQQRIATSWPAATPAPVPAAQGQRRRTASVDLLQLPHACSTPGSRAATSATNTANRST